MTFVCPKSQLSGSLKSIEKKNNIQPDVMKDEINHDLINIGYYKVYENLWRPYLIDDLLGLANVIAKLSNSNQKNHRYLIKKQFNRSRSRLVLFREIFKRKY